MCALVATLAACLPAFAQDDPDDVRLFPGGASAITETHGDWTVICEADATRKTCIASQTLGTREGRQAILSMEAIPAGPDAANILLTLPFGLDLREGVGLDLDEGDLTATAPFSACTERGCLVDMNLAPEELALFRAGGALQLTARPIYEEEDVFFSLPLRGFASALDRTIALLR